MNRLFALALIFMSSFALANPLPAKPDIYVEGSAESEVIPDQMTITLGLSAEDMDVAIAKQDVDKRAHQLINPLKAIAIDAKDIGNTYLQGNSVHGNVYC